MASRMENNNQQAVSKLATLERTVSSQITKLEKTVERLAAIINMQDKKIRTLKNDNFALKTRVETISNMISNMTKH